MVDFQQKISDEIAVVERLDSFNPSEIESCLEFGDVTVDSKLDLVVDEAKQLMRIIKVQLEYENFTLLEYAVHKLRGLFISSGCQRLAFLFEKIYGNLTKIRVEYLRYLYAASMKEFERAQISISIYLAGRFDPTAA